MPINADGFLKDLLANPAAKGALGGVAGGMLGGVLVNKKARKKLGKTAVKVGGAAAVAGLAYYAYNRWKSGQAPASAPQAGGPAAPEDFQADAQAAPRDGTFLPKPGDTAGESHLALALVTAMIGAARADGGIDGRELRTLLNAVEQADLDPAAKSEVLAKLNAPVTADDVAALATCQEMAAELYAASLAAIEVDTPAEQAYLAMLAAKLDLPPPLVAHLHDAAEAPAPVA